MVNPSTAKRWFGRVVWLGIFANLALAFPTIAAPDQMIAFFNLPTATPDMWPRFAGVTLMLLSIFYMPGAIDPDRYRATAWITLVSRLTGVIFFSFQPQYVMFALFDGVFLVPQAILLWLAVRGERQQPAKPTVKVAGV